MFKKRLRLKSKDIKFLAKRGKKIYGKVFMFHIFPQYPNIPNNQISCHISIKYNKRATERNKLKRKILKYLQDNNIINKKFGATFHKIFIGLNKKNIEKFKQVFKNKATEEKIKIIESLLLETFKLREYKILSHTSKSLGNEKQGTKK